MMTSRMAGKILGESNFPKFKIEQDPMTEEYLRFVMRAAAFRANMMEPVRRMMVAGSVFVRFKMAGGNIKMEHYLSKFTTPKYNEGGDLERVDIQYVYEDHQDKDEKGNPKKKWFKLTLGQFTDIRWNNPPYEEGAEPRFEVAESVDHGLGFVQGEWFRTGEVPNKVDGPSLIADVLGFIDELNYNFSQSSTAIQYNQDPQLGVRGMSEDELDVLIRSSQRAWNLGREGEAKFIEAGMAGVEAADNFRDKIRLTIQDIARVILLDPEKMVSHAQSGKALEVLHGPMIELIQEIRPIFEKSMISLVQKMSLAILIMNQRGEPVPVNIPPGYRPASFDVTLSWPPVFAMTIQDLRDKVNVATAVAGASLISRATMTEWLAKDFGVEDVEEEKAKIESQPVINPFGMF